jgi:hypothetical protein
MSRVKDVGIEETLISSAAENVEAFQLPVRKEKK